jgi:hypothetical protein
MIDAAASLGTSATRCGTASEHSFGYKKRRPHSPRIMSRVLIKFILLPLLSLFWNRMPKEQQSAQREDMLCRWQSRGKKG